MRVSLRQDDAAPIARGGHHRAPVVPARRARRTGAARHTANAACCRAHGRMPTRTTHPFSTTVGFEHAALCIGKLAQPVLLARRPSGPQLVFEFFTCVVDSRLSHHWTSLLCFPYAFTQSYASIRLQAHNARTKAQTHAHAHELRHGRAGMHTQIRARMLGLNGSGYHDGAKRRGVAPRTTPWIPRLPRQAPSFRATLRRRRRSPATIAARCRPCCRWTASASGCCRRDEREMARLPSTECSETQRRSTGFLSVSFIRVVPAFSSKPLQLFCGFCSVSSF
eukprot:6182732-Pleurochrysis_carterae.AAC.3